MGDFRATGRWCDRRGVEEFGVSLSNDSSPMKREASPLSPLPPPSLSSGLSARCTYLWAARGGVRKQGFCPQRRPSEMDSPVSELARTHVHPRQEKRNTDIHQCWIFPAVAQLNTVIYQSRSTFGILFILLCNFCNR